MIRTTQIRFASILFFLSALLCCANNGPNIILIVPDDHRWDATGFMQERMADFGRVARFPFMTGSTPHMDRLSEDGTHFDNAFGVYSLCSPARATMLTGLYPHTHGITNNQTDFPSDIDTYANLLQENGYTTGYFGKWHMGTQSARPGFDFVRTFYGQGKYFSNSWQDAAGVTIKVASSTEWIDDVTTDYAVDFIRQNAANSSTTPFMLFLGFKTPHSGTENGTTGWFPPARTAGIFDGYSIEPVDNINTPPPFAPTATGGQSEAWYTRDYLECIAAIDDCVGQILSTLEDPSYPNSGNGPEPSILNNTVIIYVSDNGFFRGEHGLGDKRAAYEESCRLPFMIYAPGNAASLAQVKTQLVSNLDIAPTILDLAGIPIPSTMQGVSLLPLLNGANPSDWREQIFFEYHHDAAFPTANVKPYISVRRADGYKIVKYQENSDWDELFDTNNDLYEISNLMASSDPTHQQNKAEMMALLNQESSKYEFLKIISADITPSGGSLTVKAGEGSPFIVESASDLEAATWTAIGSFEGDDAVADLSLINPRGANESATIPSLDSLAPVIGEDTDHVILFNGSQVSVNNGYSTMQVGSTTSPAGGRNAVLVFELPVIGSNERIHDAVVSVTAKRFNGASDFDADLWSLGIFNERDSDPDNNGIYEYHESNTGNSNLVKLQNAYLHDLIASSESSETVYVRVNSSAASHLTNYLSAFYENNPSYNGGSYLHLRISPEIGSINNIGSVNQRYVVKANHPNNSNSEKPKLQIRAKAKSDHSSKQFYRIRYGDQ